MNKYIVMLLVFVLVMFCCCWSNNDTSKSETISDGMYDVENDPIMQEYIALERLRLELDGEEPINNGR